MPEAQKSSRPAHAGGFGGRTEADAYVTKVKAKTRVDLENCIV